MITADFLAGDPSAEVREMLHEGGRCCNINDNTHDNDNYIIWLEWVFICIYVYMCMYICMCIAMIY